MKSTYDVLAFISTQKKQKNPTTLHKNTCCMLLLEHAFYEE